MRCSSFRSPTGDTFDGIGLDVEATALKNVALRSTRAVALAQQVRAEAAETPLAIIPFNARGLERHQTVWPGFPWPELAQIADAFAPMIYTGGGMKGFDATYGYVTRSLRLLRAATGNPDVPIHVAGGVADRLGPDELAGFAAAVADDGNTIGVSLYDWPTTKRSRLAHARLTRRDTAVTRAASLGPMRRGRSRRSDRILPLYGEDHERDDLRD